MDVGITELLDGNVVIDLAVLDDTYEPLLAIQTPFQLL